MFTTSFAPRPPPISVRSGDIAPTAPPPSAATDPIERVFSFYSG